MSLKAYNSGAEVFVRVCHVALLVVLSAAVNRKTCCRMEI